MIGAGAPVSEAVSLLVRELGDIPLIGFAGAPFTLASYLVEGGPSRNHATHQGDDAGRAGNWHALMDEARRAHDRLPARPVEAGVDAIQLFDSWAGVLSLADYRRLVLPHSSRVFAALAEYGVPMTHFGVGTAELLGAMSAAGADGGRSGLADIRWDAAARVERRSRRCRATSIRLCCWPAGRRWNARRARWSTTDAGPWTPAGRAYLQPRPRRAAGNRPGVLTDLVALVHSL